LAIFGWPSSTGKERRTFYSPATKWQPIEPGKTAKLKQKETEEEEKKKRCYAFRTIGSGLI